MAEKSHTKHVNDGATKYRISPVHQCKPISGGTRICQRGRRTMASARSASLNGGLGPEPPAGSRDRAPGGAPGRESGGRSPPEAESFL